MFTQNDEIISVFKKEGYRITKQRLSILDILRNTTAHPTAEEIYNMVKRQIPDISLGTVYRTLNILEELDLLQKLTYGESCCRYDGNVDTHYHAICLNCGRVFDVDEPVLDNLGERFSQKTDFTITEHRLELYGYCKDCEPKKTQDGGKKAKG